MDCWVNLLTWVSAGLNWCTSRLSLSHQKKISLVVLKFWIGTGILVNPKICSGSYEINTLMLVFIFLSWVEYWISWVRLDWIVFMYQKDCYRISLSRFKCSCKAFHYGQYLFHSCPRSAATEPAADFLQLNDLPKITQMLYLCFSFMHSTPFLPLAKTNN